MGGRKGWKLPSIQEFTSLIDPAANFPTLPAGHPFNVLLTSYWSGTDSANNSGFAWYLFIVTGGVFATNKPDTLYVWCVRGGSGPEAQ